MSVAELPLVTKNREIITDSLQRLYESGFGKNQHVSDSDCSELLRELERLKEETGAIEAEDVQKVLGAPIEAVVRDLSLDLIATVGIANVGFNQIWILLDLINILSDLGFCDPALSFYLVEELLDSQTIDGCRSIFDYLESRRERMIVKNFKAKNLVILRCCNELLRRLSRAEDTVFCGRVFIFLFQTFPLGDKSSVNLRGEFHTENITTFDSSPQKSDAAIKPMEIDGDGPHHLPSGAQTPASTAPESDAVQKTSRSTPVPRSTKSDSKPAEEPPDLDTLYPKFWALQNLFSSPTRLFEQSSMAQFKEGLNLTMACFKSISTTTSSIAAPTTRGTKRKHSELNGSSATTPFNPKYLTNRDLFDLEVHDLAFRRHILVQSLIMLDFLLSLSPASKQKSSGLTNKSVLYPYTLADDDLKWCLQTRASIATYLQSQGPGNEGKFYYRMVDTVLSRDKNWVRWKGESCPPITKPSVPIETYIAAQNNLIELTEKKPLKKPDDAAMFDFLLQSEPMEALKYPSERHRIPTLEDYYKGIQMDDLDMDFATDEEKKEIEERKAGKLWRALRASVYDGRRTRLCEKIEDGKNLKALIGEDEAEPEPPVEGTVEQREQEQQMTTNGDAADVTKEDEGDAEMMQTDGAGDAVEEQAEVHESVGDAEIAERGTPKPDEDTTAVEAVGISRAQPDSTAPETEVVEEQTTETAQAADADAEMDDFAPGGMGEEEDGVVE